MKSLCETRWACRYEAVRAMQGNLQVVVKLLDVIILKKIHLRQKLLLMLEACLHLQIWSFEFLLAMVVLKQLLECTNVLSLYLQSKQIDLGAAITSVDATLSVLKKYRNDSVFHGHYETASSLADMLGVDTPTVLSTRRKRVSRQMDHMWQNEHQHETIESKYRVEFYSQVLDCMIEQIEQ